MRRWALALLLFAQTAHAEPGDGVGAGTGRPEGTERIVALLPPKLAAVARPLPPLRVRPGQTEVDPADKLAWMAELGRRVDEAHGFSRSPAWRALMGWADDDLSLWPAGEPLDESIERYPVPGGRADPAVDFRASVALAWLDARRFSCQFPLRARFLARHGLTLPGPLPIERGGCPAFRRWVDPATVDIDVLTVAQRWQDASATMGHLIFRLRKRPGEHVTGASSELAFAYVAKDPPETTPNYMWRGLTGGLRATVEIERFGEVWARYGVREGRDLHVYRLALSDEERLFFLAEVFAQSRHQMRVPYAFLTVNCATMAWDTLRALLPELPEHDGLLVHPHEVVGMLAHRRATPRGTIPARKTLARDAEVARDALTLPDAAPYTQARESRWRSAAARADALRALVAHLERPGVLSALTPAQRDAVTSWADLTLDIEAFALDQATHGYRPGATGPALEAALDLRALLPTRLADTSLIPTSAPASDEPIALIAGPTSGSHASGSRRAEVSAHLIAPDADARLAVGWQTSVLDEQVGEPRLVTLNPAARMRLLVNELVVSFTSSGAAIERDRLVLVDSLTLGDTVRTDNGWLASRMGFGFGAELASQPRMDLPFMARVYGGPALTLTASRDFASHLAIVLALDVASWTRVAHGDALFRTTLGLGIEAALPLGATRIRVRGRASPGLDLGGAVLELHATLAIEVPLVPDRGIHLYFTAAWAHGLPLASPLDASVGVAFQ